MQEWQEHFLAQPSSSESRDPGTKSLRLQLTEHFDKLSELKLQCTEYSPKTIYWVVDFSRPFNLKPPQQLA